MKRALIFLLFFAMSASAEEVKDRQPPMRGEVVHVATALDHLTVLEFGEPVTMAAAGSQAFEIERHEDKVFIKPVKSGASTDLFVWTATRRFAYELDSPGEVKDMNFALDNPAPAPKPVPDMQAQMEGVADMMLTRAFLGAERIDGSNIMDTKGRVNTRVERVFQSGTTLYIHYTVRNLSGKPYRIASPTISEMSVSRPSVSITSLDHTQLNEHAVRKLGKSSERTLTVAHSEVQKADLGPGEEGQGIVAIRMRASSSTILKMSFGPEDRHPVEAVWVF
jgi:hypothetical protein